MKPYPDGVPIQSTLAPYPRARREHVMPNETAAQAKARWAREREIEADRDRDARLVANQVLPVFYD